MNYGGKYNLRNLLLEVELPTGQWVDAPLASLPEDQLERLWKNYTDTYLSMGMDLSAKDAEGLKKYNAVFLIDLDDPPDGLSDAFIVYKRTAFGIKLALLGTCQGPEMCDELRAAKSAVVKKMFELLNSGGYFLEAGEKIEEILRKSSVSYYGKTPEEKERLLEFLGPKFVEWVEIGEPLHDGSPAPEEGYYRRKLKYGTDIVTKRIYGSFA